MSDDMAGAPIPFHQKQLGSMPTAKAESKTAEGPSAGRRGVRLTVLSLNHDISRYYPSALSPTPWGVPVGSASSEMSREKKKIPARPS